MLQKEVVERMVAAPGASDYGRLSVMLQYRFGMECVLEVPRRRFPAGAGGGVGGGAHDPAPAAAAPARATRALFATVVAAAFSQRRKTLRNTLKGRFGPADFARLGIDPGLRAQDLRVEDFVRLADDSLSAAKTIENSMPRRSLSGIAGTARVRAPDFLTSG